MPSPGFLPIIKDMLSLLPLWKKFSKLQIENDLGDLEPAYRQHFLNEDTDQAVIGMVFGLVSVAILSYIDFLFYGFSPAFYQLLIFRGLFLLLSLASIWILRRTRKIEIYDVCVFIWWLGLTVIILLVDYYRPSNYVQNQMIHVLAAFCCYTFIPFPLRMRFIPPVIISTWDLIVLFFFKTNIPRPVFSITLVTIIIVQVMGIVLSVRLYTFRRRQYQAQVKEEKLFKELETVAALDGLTGLLNRRRFFELAEKEFERFKRYGNQFAVLMLDMDYFKAVNDHFGHPVGDQVLARFGSIAVENVRQIDYCGRVGGEEFAFILPETGAQDAFVFAERVRLSCVNASGAAENNIPQVTVSIGITVAYPEDTSFEQIIRRLDGALYRAKSKGRNRCELA